MSTSAIIQNNAMLINFDGQSHSIDDSHPHYDEIFECLKAKDYDEAKRLCSISFEVINWGDEELTVIGGEIAFKGKPLGNMFNNRVIRMMEENQDREPLKLFLSKLFQNPSNRSIEQIPEFVYRNSLPITTDGCILTYKKVDSELKDCHSGTFDNSPGSIVQEDRRLISDDPTKTCSKGLHVCSWYYINPNGGNMFNGSGNRLVLCKVSPENIVCIPNDYDNSKMRVCEYEVLEELVDIEDPTEIYERTSVWDIKRADSKVENYDEYDDEEAEDCEDEVAVYEDEEDDFYETLVADVESDIEKRHAVRNSKGQFCKKEDAPQPRDSKGRFLPKLFRKGK